MKKLLDTHVQDYLLAAEHHQFSASGINVRAVKVTHGMKKNRNVVLSHLERRYVEYWGRASHGNATEEQRTACSEFRSSALANMGARIVLPH